MEELVIAAEAAAKNAKRALILTMMAVITAGVILYIDQGIKTAVLEETAKARAILDEFKAVANGAKAAGEAGSVPGAGINAGNGVVLPAAGGPHPDSDANGERPAPRSRKAGVARGSSGDG